MGFSAQFIEQVIKFAITRVQCEKTLNVLLLVVCETYTEDIDTQAPTQIIDKTLQLLKINTLAKH